MSSRLALAAGLMLCVVAGRAQTPEDLETVTRQLLAAIETLSDYRAPGDLPPVFQVPQHVLEAKVCDQPCNVAAAYVPREGIYLAANLDPIREPLDRAALSAQEKKKKKKTRALSAARSRNTHTCPGAPERGAGAPLGMRPRRCA